MVMESIFFCVCVSVDVNKTKNNVHQALVHIYITANTMPYKTKYNHIIYMYM